MSCLAYLACLACLACLTCLEWRVSGADHSRRAPAGDGAYGQALAVDDQHHPWRMTVLFAQAEAVRGAGGLRP